MQQIIQKIKTSLFFFLELQLLISLVILPILIAWGLPISIMSIAGNLLFGQFLTVFIFLSALLFSTDLFGIPNLLIAQALELITSIWYYFLSFGSPAWLIGFPLWTFPISLILAIIGCSLYQFKKIDQKNRIIALGILFLTIFCIRKLYEPQSARVTITQGLQKMYIVKARGKIYTFDCGALSARPSSSSWIEYTLIPTLIKTMGATNIDLLIVCKTNSRTQFAVEELKQHMPIHQIIQIQKSYHIKDYLKNFTIY